MTLNDLDLNDLNDLDLNDLNDLPLVPEAGHL